MTRNLKALGLALVAILAMGALAAQGASAAETKHEFHADGPKTIVTGTNSIVKPDTSGTETSIHKFAVGAAGTVECSKVETESTQVGAKVGEQQTYKTDTITVVPRYEECKFGGQPATVNFNHCAYIFYGATTLGNPTEFPKEGGGTTKEEHANVEIECAEGTEIEIDTSVCTITVGKQTIKHAVRYENDKHSKNAVKVYATAHKVKTGKKVSTPGVQTGCLLFPTGEIGTYTGTTTGKCFKDESEEPTLKETAATTPKGLTKEGAETECTVSPGTP